MNENIILILKKISDKHPNGFKKKAFIKAINSISHANFEIKSGKDALKLENIGNGICKRIEEIIQTGTLAELSIYNNSDSNINDEVCQLSKITGIGDNRIKKLKELGINNVKDLRNALKNGKVLLTHHIQIGLKYYEDFNEKIPRNEVEEIAKIVIKTVYTLDPNNICTICGSFRRGKELCGDIDVIISNSYIKNIDDVDKTNILKSVVNKLKTDNYMIDSLTKNGNKKFMGVFKLNDKSLARRIDIRFISYNSYYSGILYFTGSMRLNVFMRKAAIKKKYTLNEYGLFDELHNKFDIKSEKDIFNALDLKYLNPTERDDF